MNNNEDTGRKLAPKPLTTEEVCQRLGHHRNTVNKLRKAGAFPGAFQSAGRWRYPAEAIDNYITRNSAEGSQ